VIAGNTLKYKRNSEDTLLRTKDISISPRWVISLG